MGRVRRGNRAQSSIEAASKRTEDLRRIVHLAREFPTTGGSLPAPALREPALE
jgi:hypothetical protein